MANVGEFWVVSGQFLPVAAMPSVMQSISDKDFYGSGAVRVSTNLEGTEIKWLSRSPCMSSLFSVLEWLRIASAPIRLSFHITGWFNEIFQTVGETQERINHLIQRADHHIPARTYVEQVKANEHTLKPALLEAFERGFAPPELTVDRTCLSDNNQFRVDRVGEKSAIAQIFGTATNTYPCVASSFCTVATEGYKEVLQSGKPRADHMLALFPLAGQQNRWFSFQRVILPSIGPDRQSRVHVYAEEGPISFSIL